MIREVAPAKINLALHVRHRRADGYHALETLFAFAVDGDVLMLSPAQSWSLAIQGPFGASLPASSPANGAPTIAGHAFVDDANLIQRAANAFVQLHPATPPQAITLVKNLPVASGIGGGSADAAATLRALARVMRKAPDSLHDLAAGLGADVPACLAGETALGTGRGDALARLSGLESTPLLLVNPGVGISTAAVFAGWDGIDRGPLPDGDLLQRARAGRNDLEAPATALAPVIGDVRALLDAAPGAILSRMSGSGATCFALFDTAGARASAATHARSRGWWALETSLR